MGLAASAPMRRRVRPRSDGGYIVASPDNVKSWVYHLEPAVRQDDRDRKAEPAPERHRIDLVQPADEDAEDGAVRDREDVAVAARQLAVERRPKSREAGIGGLVAEYQPVGMAEQALDPRIDLVARKERDGSACMLGEAFIDGDGEAELGRDRLGGADGLGLGTRRDAREVEAAQAPAERRRRVAPRRRELPFGGGNTFHDLGSGMANQHDASRRHA